MSDARRLPWGELFVIEQSDVVLVARAEDPADWVVSFAKSPAFPAQEWAQNMARLYNARIVSTDVVPPTPPGQRPSSYHPGNV